VDIAIRGANEHLGISLAYGAHPSGIGAMVVRFVAHGDVVPSKFTHLSYREKAKFCAHGPNGKEIIKGVRLNKVVIKFCAPAVTPFELDAYATKFGFWPQLTEWVAEQVQAEGFTPTVNLEQELKALLIPPTTQGEVKSVIEFPNMATPEQKAASLSQPSASEDEDTDQDDEDDDDKPDWLQ
jgi:hypothetical protein